MTAHQLTMTEADSGQYLTIQEVHARTGLEKSTINNYLNQGRFRRYKITTGSVFISLQEIEAWETKQKERK